MCFKSRNGRWSVDVSDFILENNSIILRYWSLFRALISLSMWLVAGGLWLVGHHVLANGILIFQMGFTGAPQVVSALECVYRNHMISIQLLMVVIAYVSVSVDAAFEGSILLVLFEIATAIEAFVKEQSNKILDQTMNLKELKVRITDGKDRWYKHMDSVAIGEQFIVYPNELIPIDGVYLGEKSVSVYKQHISGESYGIQVSHGEEICSGAVNGCEMIVLAAVSLSKDSMLQKVYALVNESKEEGSEKSLIFNVSAHIYFQAIILMTGLFGLWLFFVEGLDMFSANGVVYRAASLLTILSPCALVLAVPIAYVAFLGHALKEQILILNPDSIVDLDKHKHYVFDKTGTVARHGKCVWHGVLYSKLSEHPNAIILALCAIKQSGHFVCKSLAHLYEAKTANEPVNVLKLNETVGQGIYVEYELHHENHSFVVGNLSYICTHISDSSVHQILQEKVEALHDEIHQYYTSEVFVFDITKSTVYGFILDTHVCPSTESMIAELYRLQKGVSLISGDRHSITEKVANRLHISDFKGNVSPEEKQAVVLKKSSMGGVVMIGDGANDAPAASCADVSIVISVGDNSIGLVESIADIILLSDDLIKIIWLYDMSKRYRNVVRGNLLISLGVIFIGVILSLSQALPLWACVLLHEGSTVLVGLNSMRMLRIGKKNPLSQIR